MPAQHGACSAPAVPKLLHAKPPWVLQRGPETPCTWSRGWSWSRMSGRSIPAAGAAMLWPSLRGHCQVPPAPAPRATSAGCLMAPPDSYLGEVVGVCV